MLQKIKEKFLEFNETHYNIGYIACTILCVFIATSFGIASFEILASLLIKSALYIFSSVMFIKSLMSGKVDLLKEIKEDQNIAIAVLLAGFMAGLGMAIGGI